MWCSKIHQGTNQFASRTSQGGSSGTRLHIQQGYRRQSTPKFVPEISSATKAEFHPPTKGFVHIEELFNG